MIDRTADVVLRLEANEDEPVQQLSLEEFVEDFYSEDSQYEKPEADAIYEGLRLLAPNGEFYLGADGEVLVRFHMPSDLPW